MATFKDLFDKYSKAGSEQNVFVYGTALEDSSDGQVLVCFDNEEVSVTTPVDESLIDVDVVVNPIDPEAEGEPVSLDDDADVVGYYDDDGEDAEDLVIDDTTYDSTDDILAAEDTPASEDDLID